MLWCVSQHLHTKGSLALNLVLIFPVCVPALCPYPILLLPCTVPFLPHKADPTSHCYPPTPLGRRLTPLPLAVLQQSLNPPCDCHRYCTALLLLPLPLGCLCCCHELLVKHPESTGCLRPQALQVRPERQQPVTVRLLQQHASGVCLDTGQEGSILLRLYGAQQRSISTATITAALPTPSALLLTSSLTAGYTSARA